MGTNYYLRAKKPIEIHPSYHLGKMSSGWLPHFEYNPPCDTEATYEQEVSNEDMHLTIKSFDDARKAVASGRFEVVDEEGTVYSWEEFETKVKEHIARRGKDPSFQSYENTKDPEGYIFEHTWFR